MSSIAHRLIVFVLASIAVLFALGLSGAWQANRINGSLDYVYSRTLPETQAIAATRAEFAELRALANFHVLNNDATKMAEVDRQLAARRAALDASLSRLREQLMGEQERRLLDASSVALKAYLAKMDEALQFNRDQVMVEARDTLFDAAPLAENVSLALAKHLDHVQQRAAAESLHAAASFRNVVLLGALLTLLGAIAMAFYGRRIYADTAQPLASLRNVVVRVEAEHDFLLQAPAQGHAEVADTVSAFNRLLLTLRGHLGAIRDGIGELTGVSAEMRATAAGIAERSASQSDGVSEMAAAMEQVTVSINHVADRSADARAIALESGRLAEEGEQVIATTVARINEIAATVASAAERLAELEQHSQAIGQVVAVIREVADQTNLLALNAAIEAARAGEQGRGFAVVADEVRKLAERTSKSTRHITEIISQIASSAGKASDGMRAAVLGVDRGVAEAGEASHAIRLIGDGARKAFEQVTEISDAIRQQGEATQGIARAVETMARLAEENAATASVAREAASHLEQLAARLGRGVESYRL
ncbi:methyl-accepting chemotaxis protein [Niveibacterium sp. 24ML]|uniref:methyl-accepting chemotaxis protein n=1 Tax=Niveibacterium sp. 24ML TaxID=2985512 RepID=UPI00226FB756|nr:methyl-accepting chemotaxis protein [Niveibacterium sp. 24ML]MCX9157496.1 methyl-accepting chemotaxis protein [Niveibacterium sp. 24ML]